MPHAKLLLHAEELRARAEEISARADTFQDADSQQKMRDVAKVYEKLAQRLETAAGATGDAYQLLASRRPKGERHIT